MQRFEGFGKDTALNTRHMVARMSINEATSSDGRSAAIVVGVDTCAAAGSDDTARSAAIAGF